MSNSPAKVTPSKEQKAIIEHITDELAEDTLVIAGPGSGKTRTLVGSIAALVSKGATADKIVAISFTNNSAAELKVRLAKMASDHEIPALHRVHVSTFHAWVGQLQARRIEPWKYPPIALKSASLAVALHLKNPDPPTHCYSKGEISAADRAMEGCETFAAMEERNFNQIKNEPTNREGFENLKTAVSALETEMAASQITTFGTQMKAGATLAGQLNGDDVDWLFIDEAQDVNSTQAGFVQAVKHGTNCKVFVIADDDQGIYKFRGASNAFLRDFGNKASTRTFQLSENFRSTETIVKACVNWIRPNWEAIGSAEKKLFSGRAGLPVGVLTHPNAKTRAKHATLIIKACKKNGLIKTYGETAILGLSSAPAKWEFEAFDPGIHAVSDPGLPEGIFRQWIELLKNTENSSVWHHKVWSDFLSEITQDQQREPQLGFPGLNDLYAALEVCRRMHPDYSPVQVAKILTETVCAVGDDGKATNNDLHPLIGSRPDPDYEGDKVNYISFHSSKGMEFPVVWLTNGPFTLAPKDWDKKEGQPNLLGELGEWALKLKLVSKIVGATPPEIESTNEKAASMENRRLLYVAMSRASDLLIITAPWSRKDERKMTYTEELMGKCLKGVSYQKIYSDDEAQKFAASIGAFHRNPHWSPPKRYRVESYSSLSNQILPGEKREVEIPKDREYPQAPNDQAILGDQFHRVMHLLCTEPSLIAQHEGGVDLDALVRRVTEESSKALEQLLKRYFTDKTNAPYRILKNDRCRSELPFMMLDKDPNNGEEILVKGFLDLVRFDDQGNPNLILDYKTGSPTQCDDSHKKQLELYRRALAQNYSVRPKSIDLVNYYVSSQEWVAF